VHRKKGGLNGYANARDRNLFDEILESDDRGWAFVSLAGILIVIVLGQAMQLTAKVAKPISNVLPVQTMVGVRAETVLAVLVLVLFSLVAGLVARTNLGKRIMSWSENSILGGLPQYQLAKSMAEGLAHVENAKSVHPALVSIEGGWQIGYCSSRLSMTGSPYFCRRRLPLCQAM
jgi:uncharacterized membrane protein